MLQLVSRRQKQLLAISLVLAAGFYLAFIFWAGFDVILQTISKLSVFDWSLLLLSSFCSYSLRFVRWHLYAQALGHSLQKRLHFLYYLAGFALTTTPAKAGEILRSYFLKQHGIPYHKSIAMFVTERFLDVLIVACLASMTLYLFGDYGQFVIFATAIVIALLLLIKSSLFRHLLHLASRLLKITQLQILIQHLLNLLKTSQTLLGVKLLSTGLLLGIIAWSLQGAAFYYMLNLLGLDISLATAMGVYAISLLAGAATFVPGGVGGTEVVMGLLLAASGADTAVAVTAPLIGRLSTLWFAVALGMCANFILSQHRLTAPR